MLRSVISLTTLALLAGCTGLGGLGKSRAAAVAPPNAEVLQAAQLAGYITEQQRLVQGGPAEQAETLAAARQAFEQQRQGAGTLRYGLALAAPGHPGRGPAQAQRLLREALARPELLTVTERALAVVELQRIDSELRLQAENLRLVGEAQHDRDRLRSNVTAAALTRRLQTEMEETARLRKALEEARAKLDAIATIERSLSDRPPANEGRTP
jgi:hypothetical protein